MRLNEFISTQITAEVKHQLEKVVSLISPSKLLTSQSSDHPIA